MTTATKEKSEAPAASDRDAKFRKTMKSLAATCKVREADWKAAKAEAAEAKASFDAALAALQRAADDDDSQLELPLGEPEAEAWRDTPIGDAIKLTDKQIENLAEAGIATVGDFEDVRAGKNSDYQRLTDIPRVGQATADKWEDEILDWLAANATQANEDVEGYDEPADDDADD